MRRTLVLVLLAACSGDAETPIVTDTADPDPVLTDDTPTLTEDTGWTCADWYDCQDCGAVSCSDEIGACSGDPACGSALNAWASCVLQCGEDPADCADAFAAAGGPAAPVLFECARSTCPVECGY